jgi:hypothetical protein
MALARAEHWLRSCPGALPTRAQRGWGDGDTEIHFSYNQRKRACSNDIEQMYCYTAVTGQMA